MKKIIMLIISIFVLINLHSISSAEQFKYVEQLTNVENDDSMNILEKKEAKSLINEDKAKEFWGNFGVTLLYNQDIGKNKPVKSAKIVNGKVVVSEENDVRVGLGLEAHQYIGSWAWNSPDGLLTNSIACGLYTSVLPGSDSELIDSVGIGGIVGFYHFKPTYDENKKKQDVVSAPIAMNLLVGVYADPGTKILANGFKDGQTAPAGVTDVEYKTVTQWGLQLGVSFSAAF